MTQFIRQSVGGFGLQGDVLLAASLALMVLLDPQLKTLTRGGVAAGKPQARNVRVINRDSFAGILGKHSNAALAQGRAAGPVVEDVSLNLLTIAECNSHITAIIAGLVERGADLIRRCQTGNLPMQLLARCCGC